jgi:hypothetical protein
MKRSNTIQATIPQNAEADKSERIRAIRMMAKMHKAEVLRFFPHTGPLRFILGKTKDGKVIAELSDSLSKRSFELAWKVPASQLPLVAGLMHLACLPLDAYSNQNGWALFEVARLDNANPSNLIPASLALERLVQHLGDPIGRLWGLPKGRARDEAAKELKKRLCDAVDALNAQSQAKLHAKRVKITVPLGDGTAAKMALAAVAIREARQFVERERKEPTKAELRRELESKFAQELREVKAADSFWTKVWAESGLEGLEEDTPYSTTRKTS